MWTHLMLLPCVNLIKAIKRWMGIDSQHIIFAAPHEYIYDCTCIVSQSIKVVLTLEYIFQDT